MTNYGMPAESGEYNITGYQALLLVDILPTVRQLLDGGQYQLAVVIAQVACELRTEQVMRAAINKVEPASLRDWLHKSARRGNNLADPRTSERYTALTGDKINPGEGLWQQYVKHVDRRNEVAHRGANVSKEDAEHSYETARKVIEHLTSILKKLSA
jgi:HEPN domain-containing protein